MKVYFISLIVLSFFLLSACEKNDTPLDGNEILIGNWINPQTNESTITYDRSLRLQDNNYGFTINQNGKFTERKNAGWCGTPPVSYADFEGNWSRNDSLMNITVGYWGGLADYKWKILSLDDKRLTIVIISQEYSEN
jgi:hypothetical protein